MKLLKYLRFSKRIYVEEFSFSIRIYTLKTSLIRVKKNKNRPSKIDLENRSSLLPYSRLTKIEVERLIFQKGRPVEHHYTKKIISKLQN